MCGCFFIVFVKETVQNIFVVKPNVFRFDRCIFVHTLHRWYKSYRSKDFTTGIFEFIAAVAAAATALGFLHENINC